VEARRQVSALESPRVDVRKPDPVLGMVAVGSMLLILASVITGIDVLGLFALLIALVYVRIAGALKSVDTNRRNAGRLPHALTLDARFNRAANAGIVAGPLREVSEKGAGNRVSTRMRRRSAYEGLTGW